MGHHLNARIFMKKMNMVNFLKAPDFARQENVQLGMFRELDATELYCPNCRKAVPVRKHLLCILPEGKKYEYRCVYCVEQVGTKTSSVQG